MNDCIAALHDVNGSDHFFVSVRCDPSNNVVGVLLLRSGLQLHRRGTPERAWCTSLSHSSMFGFAVKSFAAVKYVSPEHTVRRMAIISALLIGSRQLWIQLGDRAQFGRVCLLCVAAFCRETVAMTVGVRRSRYSSRQP